MRTVSPLAICLLMPACTGRTVTGSTCAAGSGVGQQGATARASANNAFALSLEDQLGSDGGNVFFSPYSLSVALGMLYQGAATTSATALAQTAGFDAQASSTGQGFAQLACDLTSDAAAGGNTLDVGDAIFVQQGKTLAPAYLSSLQGLYAAPATPVDFAGNPSGAASTIDDWVSQATEGTIPMLLSASDVSSGTQLVLVNAVYFHGSWASGFDPAKTASAPFTTEAGSVVQVPTMNAVLDAGFAVPDRRVQVLELTYQGGQLALDLILPLGAPLAALEAGLTANTIDTWLSSVQPVQVEVALPKLSLKPRYNLGNALETLGMGPLFDPTQADLSGIDGARDLFVQWVIQQATLTVDETGTVASAATGVGIGTSAFQEPPSFLADHPFLVILRDLPTGAWLFYGRIADPSASQ
jgi:serpin B